MTSSQVDVGEMEASAGVRVADVIRRAAERRPGVVALRHGERELTYAQLDERSSRLAQALLAAGIGAGSRVAYLGRTAPEVIELLFAVSKIGAVIVPLNWRLSPRELAGVLENAQPAHRRAEPPRRIRGMAGRARRRGPRRPRPAERRDRADVHLGDDRG